MSDIVCVQCKYIGKPKMKKRGSAKLEFMGWAVFPLGVPYSIWRMLARTPVCKACGSSALLPADGVAGQRLIQIAVGEVRPNDRYTDEDDVIPPLLPKEPVLSKRWPRSGAQHVPPTPVPLTPTPVTQPVAAPAPEPVYQPAPEPVYQAPPPPPPVVQPMPVQELSPPPPPPAPPPVQTAAPSPERKERLDPNVW